jgi:hypothetical protein
MDTVEGYSPSGSGFVGPEGVLNFEVAYPEHLSRGLIFIKWLLVIPHFIILYFLGIAMSVVTFIAWFAILFTGAYPRGMWDFALMVQRWQMRVSVYTYLMRDEYPPFGDEPYPLRYELAYPQHLSRWLIFIKWLMIIPHLICLMVLGFVAGLALIFAWFAILFTGQYPRGCFDFLVGVLRWSARVNLYAGLMTDVYPPFALD